MLLFTALSLLIYLMGQINIQYDHNKFAMESVRSTYKHIVLFTQSFLCDLQDNWTSQGKLKNREHVSVFPLIGFPFPCNTVTFQTEV